MATRAIERDLLLELSYDDVRPGCDWSLVDKRITGTWRWGNEMEMVLHHRPSGLLWGFSYRVTTGDESRNHIHDEPEQVELFPMVARTTIEYVYDEIRGQR